MTLRTAGHLGRRAAAAALCLAVLSLARPASAIDPAAGTGGAAFMKMGMGSARSMAMGRAYTALAEGAEALTANPAGLALAQQREATYSYLRYVQDIDAPFYLGYAHPFGRTVLGANVSYLSVDGFDARDSRGVPVDSSNVRVQSGFATLALSRSFWYEKLFLGAGLRGIHEDNAGTLHNVLAGDIGLLFKPNPYVTFGFATQNFGAGQARVASTTRSGVAFRLFEMLNLSMELSKPSDNAMRVALGGEFILPEDFLQIGQIALRVGYAGTDDMGKPLEEDRSALYPLVDSPKISYGVGLYSAQAFGYGISFDYALVPMGGLGTVDQLSLKVKF